MKNGHGNKIKIFSHLLGQYQLGLRAITGRLKMQWLYSIVSRPQKFISCTHPQQSRMGVWISGQFPSLVIIQAHRLCHSLRSRENGRNMQSMQRRFSQMWHGRNRAEMLTSLWRDIDHVLSTNCKKDQKMLCQLCAHRREQSLVDSQWFSPLWQAEKWTPKMSTS